jgi:hypothetical protein
MTEYHQSIPSVCSALRKNGAPCSAKPTRSGLCFVHDPRLKEKRADARRLGGSNSSHKNRLAQALPSSLRPVFDRLVEALEEVHEGRLSATRGQAMASLGSAAVRTFSSAQLEERVRSLETGK